MSEDNIVLHAHELESTGRKGRIFGPVDLDVRARQLCMVHGPLGSGKSALLLALTGRFRPLSGSLTIDGIDAIQHPLEAMQMTSVAQLGDYVRPEDRLTLAESVVERCFIDGFPRSQAAERVAAIEETVGFRIEQHVELETLTPIEKAVASVALAMIRPSRVVVIDDADMTVPHSQQSLLFSLLERLTALDDSVIVASVVDADLIPATAVSLSLRSDRPQVVEPLGSEPVPSGLARAELRPITSRGVEADDPSHPAGPTAAPVNNSNQDQ